MRGPTSQVGGISLRRMLPEAEIVGADDICVSSCTADERYCRAGDLFVVPGGGNDVRGTAIEEAVRRGAAAILTDRPAAGCRLPACYVTNVQEAFGRVCQGLAGDPSRRLKLVGITGTQGKTTTSYLVAGVLAAAGHRPGVLSTLGYSDGSEAARAPWSTPPAPVLATWLARMLANGCTHGIVEASSDGLAGSRLAGVELDVACLTNVGRGQAKDGTQRQYEATQARILEHLIPEGVFVVNADDEVARGYLNRCDGPVVSVGIDSAAEVTAAPVEQCASEQTFLLSMGSETVPVRTRLIGRHNVSNCLVAAAVGLVYGIDLTTIVRGLESIECIPGRLEPVRCGQPFGVFVDYASSPEALAGCLETLRGVASGRLICVYGGRPSDVARGALFGRVIEEAADVAIISGDEPGGQQVRQAAADIVSGFRQPGAARVIGDRGEAIRWALAEARPGDCVLIAGDESSAARQPEEIEGDDGELAREWLYAFQPGSGLDRAA